MDTKPQKHPTTATGIILSRSAIAFVCLAPAYLIGSAVMYANATAERERQQSTQTTPESTEEDYARERRTADTLTAWANNPSTDMDWATDPLLFLRAEMPPYVVEASNCEAWITELMKASTAAETGAPVEFLLDCLADPKKPHLWCAVGVNGLRPAAFYGGEGLKAAQMVDKELADLVRRRLSEVGSADTAGIRDMMPPP